MSDCLCPDTQETVDLRKMMRLLGEILEMIRLKPKLLENPLVNLIIKNLREAINDHRI